MYPLTSIIILTKNNIQFLERCIFSIYEHINPQHTPYEIFVADENSIDGTKEFCELHRHHLTYLNLPEANAFSKRNNAVVRQAKGEFLWFLNNDTEQLNNTLHYMLRHFSDPQIGMVSHMHLFPNMSLNHMGIAISDTLHPEHIFPHEDPNLPYINHGRFIDIVSHASVICRRSAFEQVGGYDEAYGWGYEDIDLCYKIREAGYKIYCDNEARMIHFGQSTYGRADRDKQNYEIFLSRWQEKLKSNIHEIYAEKDAYLQHQHSVQKLPKRALRKAMKALKGMNAGMPMQTIPADTAYIKVSPTFTAFADLADRTSRSISQKHTVIKQIEDLYSVEHPPKQGAILLTTTHFSEEYLVPSPGWVRDYRTYDVNYERTDYSNPDYWTKSLQNAPFTILASSEFCKDFLIKSSVPAEKIFVVGHGYNPSMTKFDFSRPNPDPKDVNIFVVINTNDESRYGTEHLATALKLLATRDPEIAQKITVHFKNYGGKDTTPYFKTKEYFEINQAGIKMNYVSKFLSEDELAQMYYQCDMLVAPYHGEGFGMKLIDAAVAGMPIIAPDYGGPRDYLKYATHLPVKYSLVPVSWGLDRNGLILDDTYVWADVDPEDLYRQIKHAIENISELKREAISKRDYIRREFSYQAKWDKLLDIDKQLTSKEKPAEQEFDFYDAEFSREIETSAHKALSDIKETLLINTNRLHNLPEFLDHLSSTFDLNKDLQGEILIIDDASGEDATELMQKYDHLPVSYKQYTQWGGSGFARDVGLRYAQGDLVIITGDDIKPMPGFFRKHREHYEKHPEPYLLMGHVEWDKNIRNDPVAEFTTKVTSFQFGFEEIRNASEITYWHIYTPNVSFRRSAVKTAKQHFKVGMALFEDTIWAKELAEKGFKMYYNRSAYALHNHKVQTTWLDWLQSRSTAVGKYQVMNYTSNPKLGDVLGDTGKAISHMTQVYSKSDAYGLESYTAMFDGLASALNESYAKLLEEDIKSGYIAENRHAMYDVLHDHYVLYKNLGIASALTPNLDLAKALTVSYYLKARIRVNSGVNYPLGLKDSIRHTIFVGRKRFPQIFEPIFKLGQVMKSLR